jgi:hypothetical protein
MYYEDDFNFEFEKKPVIKVSKKEAIKKVIELTNKLSLISSEIRKMEKYYCVDSIDYDIDEKKYLKLYEDKLNEESKVFKELAFYMERC